MVHIYLLVLLVGRMVRDIGIVVMDRAFGEWDHFDCVFFFPFFLFLRSNIESHPLNGWTEGIKGVFV